MGARLQRAHSLRLLHVDGRDRGHCGALLQRDAIDRSKCAAADLKGDLARTQHRRRPPPPPEQLFQLFHSTPPPKGSLVPLFGHFTRL